MHKAGKRYRIGVFKTAATWYSIFGRTRRGDLLEVQAGVVIVGKKFLAGFQANFSKQLWQCCLEIR